MRAGPRSLERSPDNEFWGEADFYCCSVRGGPTSLSSF